MTIPTDNYFKSSEFKDLVEFFKQVNKLELTITSKNILNFAHRALTDGIAIIEDKNDDAMSSAIQSFIANKICTYFKIKSLYTSEGMFNNKLLLPMDQFVDVTKEFGNEIYFVEWFIPFELNNEILVLTKIFGQGESILAFETLKSAKKRFGDSAWSQIKKTYPIETIFN